MKTALTLFLQVALAICSLSPFGYAEIVRVGTGSYSTIVPAAAQTPAATILRTDKIPGPMPSNDWWSSSAWPGGTFAQYPHPLAVKVESSGLRIYYPGPSIRADKTAVFGFIPGGKDDFILGHSAVAQFSRPLVDGFSDWFVDLLFATNQNSMRLSFGHGSPFVYAVYTGGRPILTFAEAATIWSGDAHSATLGVSIHGRHYGLFAPTGSSWSGLGSSVLACDSKDKQYFSVAILPDNEPATLALFQRHAHAHVTGTQVDWKYDPAMAAVTTQFTFQTTPLEGAESGTLFTLYPHQWRHAETQLLPYSYNSVRGTMKLAEGKSFSTRTHFTGILPALPNVGGCDAASVASSLATDLARPAGDATDTYWASKQLGRLANLIPIAEIYGLPEADTLREKVQLKVEGWLSALDGEGHTKSNGMFCYNTNWGTLIGYPASYGSDKDLNDHHFHYGYLLKAAAEVARHDPSWAKADRWGGMVELLIRDFASPDRHDSMFPFLRNFDPYAGHSWASGHAQFGDGNNNESSSEAMNAWTGLILWGEASGNPKLRDLGVWLYTTEMQAIQEYWFDVTGENHPSTYTPSVMTMIWGGKSANGTWFTADPQLVHGINWLPIHGGSLYLGHFPSYAAKNYEALVAEHGNDHWNNWPDLIWMYRALSDPADAIRLLNAAPANTKLEDGNSWTNARHWIYNLQKLGAPAPDITCSETLAAVFRRGTSLTYVAFNAKENPRTVHFSDGQQFQMKALGYTVKTNGK